MNSVLEFFLGLGLLVLFGWYFATDRGLRKHVLAATLVTLLVVFSIWSIWPLQKKVRLGLDIKGGTSFLIRLKSEDKTLSKGMLDQAVEVIRKRVDYFGSGEPVISPVGTDRILVQIPGLDTAKIQEARDQLSRVAKLEFRLVYPDGGERLRAIDAGIEVIPPEYRIETYKMQGEEGQKPVEERLLVKKKADLGGDRVTHSAAYYGNEGWTVQLKFDSAGAKTFGQITEANVGHRFAIVLDGVIQSAPSIRTAIYGGDAIITGRFTEKEARGLASVLENPLQVPVSIEEERSVSPTLGMDSIRASIRAGLIGLAITLLCVAIYYKFAGLVVNLALIVNLILLLGAFQLVPGGVVLTLPGIAGIILTIGMAVDASVLIYERLREEMASGKSLRAALPAAYDKAFSSILDANVTTLITAFILFSTASGPVKGFAIVAHARNSGLAFHRPDCGTQRSWLAGGERSPHAHLDAPTDFHQALEFPRQRVHRQHVLARPYSRRRGRFLRAGREELRGGFSRWRPGYLERPAKGGPGRSASRAKYDRLSRRLDPAIAAGRQELHHNPQPAEHER